MPTGQPSEPVNIASRSPIWLVSGLTLVNTMNSMVKVFTVMRASHKGQPYA